MKRKDAIALIRYAGYHEDTGTGLRIYIENRISYEAYTEAFNEGRKLKRNGMKYNCRQCKE